MNTREVVVSGDPHHPRVVTMSEAGIGYECYSPAQDAELAVNVEPQQQPAPERPLSADVAANFMMRHMV